MESPIQSYLQTLHAEIRDLRNGSIYSVDPVAEVNPDDFGICLATVDGFVYEVGTTRQPFPLQSISKPFTYAMALAELGPEAVDAKVDVEPSGDPFNEVSLAAGTGRPANAMINAGALAVVSMIKGSGGQSAIKRIVKTYSEFAGRRLTFSRRLFEAEMRNSDRNHALAYLLRSFGIIETDPTVTLENYLRQCAVQVTCRDLSLMAATLANGGTNPITGHEVLEISSIERVLSVMMTSGMYDDAGAWVSDVGMPAKSGVSGGTIAVLPGQAALAVFSPPLDAHGGSIRGIATCQRLSRDMEMHFVRSARAGRSAIRASYPITDAPSGIRRTEEAMDVLFTHSHRARIIELNGDLLFAGTESVVREVSGLDDDVEFVVLDVRRLDEISQVGLRMLAELAERLAADERHLLLIDREGLMDEVFADQNTAVPTFDNRGAAVEYCEDQLLAIHAAHLGLTSRVPVAAAPALDHLTPDDKELIIARMEPRTHEAGDIIRRVGQRFGGVYFIVSGQVTLIATDADGNRSKLTTLSAGMTFGELALGSDDRQETTERAEGPVELMLLTAETIEDLQENDPRLAMELWRALTRDALIRVDHYLRETAVRIRY